MIINRRPFVASFVKEPDWSGSKIEEDQHAWMCRLALQEDYRRIVLHPLIIPIIEKLITARNPGLELGEGRKERNEDILMEWRQQLWSAKSYWVEQTTTVEEFSNWEHNRYLNRVRKGDSWMGPAWLKDNRSIQGILGQPVKLFDKLQEGCLPAGRAVRKLQIFTPYVSAASRKYENMVGASVCEGSLW